MLIANFPPHDIDPKKKVQKEWCKEFAVAIHALYNNNQTSVGVNDTINFARLRAYGNGMQDPNQYKPRLGMGKKTGPPSAPRQTVSTDTGANSHREGDNKGWMNVSWDILAIAPKFKSVVMGSFEDVEHDIFCDGIDDKSSMEKERIKWDLWIEKEYGPYFAAQEQAIGLQSEKPPYVPQTLQELEMFTQLGGIKLRHEISMEAGLKYTFDVSDWKEIKRRLIEDEFELGMAGVRDYVDTYTQKVKLRYVDPQFSVVPYMKRNQYDKIPFAGEYIFLSIAELRGLNDVDGKPTFTEDQLKNIAQCVVSNPPTVGNYPYPAPANWLPNEWGVYQYDGFMIPILDCEFLSDDYKYNTERTKEDGTKVVSKEDFGRVRKGDKKKTHVTKTLMVYKCKWIVGTEYVYDYGHQYDIVRPTPSEARLSFHFYKIPGKSKMESMVPVLDSLQLNWLKLQNAKAIARPKGLAIEYNSLLNVGIETGGKNKPLDILRISSHTGNLLYSATTHSSYAPGAMNQKPIQELENGLGAHGVELINLMQSDFALLQDITGINRIADASSPNADDLVGVTEMALQATSNALKPIFSAYTTIKQRVAKNAILRLQLIMKYSGAYKLGYIDALGLPFAQTLELDADIVAAQYGIRVEVRPSAMEKQRILEAAMESMRAGKNGYMGISMSDYFTIENFLSNGMIKLAKAYLAQKERELEERNRAETAENQQLQGQVQQQLEQVKQQGEIRKEDFEIKKILITAEEERKTLEAAHLFKMKEIQLQGNQKIENTAIDGTFKTNQVKMQIESSEQIAKEEPKAETTKV